MKKILISSSLILALSLLGVMPHQPSLAQGSKLVAGTLTCRGQGSVGLVLGSEQVLSCTYVPAGSGSVENYSATLTKFGLDIGFKSGSVMLWTVLGSSTSLARRELAGSYVGASAEATVALGVGANALIGGSNNSVVLQPVSVQGQTGLNLAVGVTGFTLRL